MRGPIYISGPMSGLPDHNFPAFHAAAAALRARGWDVVNPAELSPGTTDWAACMRADIKALCDCADLALLPGWAQSKGAQLELHIAHRLGLHIHALQDLMP
jgi:Tfp pilus assembly protein PilX